MWVCFCGFLKKFPQLGKGMTYKAYVASSLRSLNLRISNLRRILGDLNLSIGVIYVEIFSKLVFIDIILCLVNVFKLKILKSIEWRALRFMNLQISNLKWILWDLNPLEWGSNLIKFLSLSSFFIKFWNITYFRRLDEMKWTTAIYKFENLKFKENSRHQKIVEQFKCQIVISFILFYFFIKKNGSPMLVTTRYWKQLLKLLQIGGPT